jgi:hypothetical protein
MNKSGYDSGRKTIRRPRDSRGLIKDRESKTLEASGAELVKRPMFPIQYDRSVAIWVLAVTLHPKDCMMKLYRKWWFVDTLLELKAVTLLWTQKSEYQG